MARSIEQIKQEIINKKDEYPELGGLNSPSKTAIWRLWVEVFAFVLHVFEKLFDVFKDEITSMIESKQIATPQWYREKVMEFEPNKEVVIHDYKAGYANPQVENRIISRCAIEEIEDIKGVKLKIKVLKNDPPEPLDAAELSQLSAYIERVKFAGTRTEIVSLAPDVLFLHTRVYSNKLYDALYVKEKVQSSIKAFIDSLPFNAELKLNFLVSELIKLGEVEDLEFVQVLVTPAGSAAVPVSLSCKPLSGAFVYDETSIVEII